MKQDVFIEMPCLNEDNAKLYVSDIRKKWFKGSDKRTLGQTIQKFLEYNKVYLDFLGIESSLTGIEDQIAITFKTQKFIGAIPLRSPVTGKQIGDLIVKPRFQNRSILTSGIVDLMIQLETYIEPEFIGDIPLSSGIVARPPLYFESIKYIDILHKSLDYSWRKFNVKNTVRKYPKGSTDWNKFSYKSYDPANMLKYPCKESTLTYNHLEMSYLKYVFNVAKSEITSPRTPSSIKYRVIDKVRFIDSLLKELPQKSTNKLHSRESDPPIIKNVKKQGNLVLKNGYVNSPGWRVDISILFERYVQHIVELCSNELILSQHNNYKINKSDGYAPYWGLRNLEPDIIISTDFQSIVIDAKYKTHLYNYRSDSDKLRTTHREDLHQLLAYCSFATTARKTGILVYPSSKQFSNQIEYYCSIRDSYAQIYYVGIPFEASEIDSNREFMKRIITDIISETNH